VRCSAIAPAIGGKQKSHRALAERRARQQAEQDQVAQARTRQRARRAQQKIARADHRGGKWDVLGVVEHRAVPGPAQRERQGRKHARARSADHARGRPGRRDAADANQHAEPMPDHVNVGRQDISDQHGNDVEQPAVEIEVAEIEQRPIGKSAGVIGDDELAVAMLHFFVVGNGVVVQRR
jgi:hypothetical protein